MKNIKYLFLIPILFVLFGVNGVKAATAGLTTSLRGEAPLKLPNMAYGETIAGSHNMHYFTIDNTMAFCLSPGKKMRNGATYVKAGNITGDTKQHKLEIAAYEWAKDHQNDDPAYRVAAQVFLWSVANGITTKSELVAQMQKALYHVGLNFIDAATNGENWYTEINKKDIDDIILTEWKYAGSESEQWQILLTDFDPDLKITQNYRCKKVKDKCYNVNYQAVNCSSNWREGCFGCQRKKDSNGNTCYWSKQGHKLGCDKEARKEWLNKCCDSMSESFQDKYCKTPKYCKTTTENSKTVYYGSSGTKVDYNTYKVQCPDITDDPTFNACSNPTGCSLSIEKKMDACDSEYNYNSSSIRQVPNAGCEYAYTTSQYNASGEFTASYGSYCRMFCLSTYNHTYPGKVHNVELGTYLVWPNNNINLESQNSASDKAKLAAKLQEYPLEVSLEKNCKIYVSCDATTDYDNYQTLMRMNSSSKSNYFFSGTVQRVNISGKELKTTNTTVQTKTCDKLRIERDNAYNTCYNYANNIDCSGIDDADSRKDCYKSRSDAFSRCSNGRNIQSCGTIGTKCLGLSGDSYDSCVERINDCREGYTSTEDEKPGADGSVVSATDRYLSCRDYKTGYEGAQSVINSMNSCATANISQVDFDVNYSVTYDDPEYGETTFALTKKFEDSTCDGCTSDLGKLDNDPEVTTTDMISLKSIEIQSRAINTSVTKYYDLKDGYYNYVDLTNNKSTHTIPSSENYSYIGFSNEPISRNYTNFKKEYYLHLATNISGTPFDNTINNFAYACPYTVTPPGDGCICPDNSDNPGMSLACPLQDGGLTCADAIQQYCYSNGTHQYCTDDAGNKWDMGACLESGHSQAQCENTLCKSTCEPNICPYYMPNGGFDLTPCVGEGTTLDSCISKYCTDEYEEKTKKKWVCPSGTNEGMNLSACVIPMLERGYSEQYAYEYCEEVTCPYGGKKIIYRVIDLSNPFPSYDGVGNAKIKIGTFNDTVKGRYPGRNWNGSKTVQTKILNNRSVDGDAVYDKTPLYTFELTSENIKAIRAYNRGVKDKYADFNLKCLLNNSAACKSDFIRSSIAGLTGGTCKSVTKDSFYKCDD